MLPRRMITMFVDATVCVVVWGHIDVDTVFCQLLEYQKPIIEFLSAVRQQVIICAKCITSQDRWRRKKTHLTCLQTLTSNDVYC